LAKTGVARRGKGTLRTLSNSFHTDLDVHDAEIMVDVEFRKRLYDHDVVAEPRAAAVELA